MIHHPPPPAGRAGWGATGRCSPVLGLSWLLLAVGCGGERVRQDCRIERETVIAVTTAAPAAVAVARGDGGQWLAAWSADGVTWTVWIDDRGVPLGEPLPILRDGVAVQRGGAPASPRVFWEEQTGGSLAAEAIHATPAGGGAVLVAMVQVPAPGRPGGVHVALVPAPPLAEEPRAVHIGPAGPASNSVSVATLGRRALVAWHDTTSSGPRVLLCGFDIEAGTASDYEPMPGAVSRFHPSLAAGAETALVAWAEELPLGTRPQLAIRAAPIGWDLAPGESRLVARTGIVDAAPHLVAAGDGFGLVFRDDEDDDGVLEYHFAALDQGGAIRHQPSRISRADGARGPYLDWGGTLFVGVTVRSFQRNLLVGLNRFDDRGVKRGGEFQIYADKSNFIRTAVSVGGDGALLVYGEERSAGGRVLASRVHCRAP